jgi:RNA polymerase sigma-70 factor (ECF subfamily)
VSSEATTPVRAESTESVDAFYRATYPRLVSLLTLAAGDRATAEDVVQEAFLRLVPRWERVAAYEDPEAWVRTVALRLCTSRWRRAQSALRTLGRLGAPRATPPPSGARVDAERLLARLSPAHRQVLVLHHGLDMSVRDIALLLGVPEGTVKSRLSRARAEATSNEELS